MKKKLAFTLVELLIVVIILGILAAVVIPQFSDASEDARVSSLQTNLATMRGQIELYKMQHGGYPLRSDFVAQMTQKTNADGTFTGTPKYGPYMQAIPANPFCTAASPANSVLVGTAVQAATSAWYYNEDTGEFRADDSAAHAAY